MIVVTTIQQRAEWNARPWTGYQSLNWANVTKFIVHYSGAARSQTTRSIQDYCMDKKGHSDIDYNELVKGDVVYIGRGDHAGGHTLGNNTTSYGICMIGLDGDATDADFQSIRERYEYACGRATRRLLMLGHRDAPQNVGTTNCPGNELENWIKAGMPWPNPPEDDMQTISICKDAAGQLYASDGMTSRKIIAEDIIHMKTLAKEGRYQLLNADNPRAGWFPGAFGPITSTVPGPPGLPGKPGADGADGRTPTVVALEISGVDVPAKVTEYES